MDRNNLYNAPVNPDNNVLINTAICNKESDTELSIFDTEVMDAINTLKEGKSHGIVNIPSELMHNTEVILL